MKKLCQRICDVVFAASVIVMFAALMAVIWTPESGFSFYPQVFASAMFTAIFAAFGGMWTC